MRSARSGLGFTGRVRIEGIYVLRMTNSGYVLMRLLYEGTARFRCPYEGDAPEDIIHVDQALSCVIQTNATPLNRGVLKGKPHSLSESPERQDALRLRRSGILPPMVHLPLRRPAVVWRIIGFHHTHP